ncbi:MAG: PAS-domain containing protein [Hyphomicrobiales bacterium]|nr:PAS-domain containing protein [Hyphomicrobiales bacterium]
MIASWTVILAALVYLCLLFVVAQYGDRGGKSWLAGRPRATIYALGLSVYCTSWTIYGSVDFASINGIAFLGIYVGPALVFLFGTSFLTRIARIAKSQNSTSIADLIASRYGKNELVAAAVALIALVAVIPYIALQLKAVSASLTALLASLEGGSNAGPLLLFGDLSLIVALVLSGFAIAFGTRHIDATEHQDGLMLAIAMEAIVKLCAFLIVGLVIVAPAWLDRLPAAMGEAETRFVPWRLADPVSFLTMAGLSVAAILLLPRQFHVTFVENRSIEDIRRSSWMFPLYLALINLLVLPIASAGLALAPRGGSENALLLLAVPLSRGETATALIAFIGGLSASTAMVIVDSIAVAIMISNHLAVPLVLRFNSARNRLRDTARNVTGRSATIGDMTGFILAVRRVAIFAVVMLGYLYFRNARGEALAAIGLLSFAAIAQIFPSFLAALFWRNANARGALWALGAGSVVWIYTLLLPSFAGSRHGLDLLLAQGPMGISWLRPEHLFGLKLPPLTHGVFWSLSANLTALILGSLSRGLTRMERVQAAVFVRRTARENQPGFARRERVSIAELRDTVARFLGPDRARRAFESFLGTSGSAVSLSAPADVELVRRVEHLLSSAIGAASARLVLALLTRRPTVSSRDALQLLGDTSAALQQKRDLLQHALDHARQGITVFDEQRNLLTWNRAWLELYDLPSSFVKAGVKLEEIVRFNARRGLYGEGDAESFVEMRVRSFFESTDPVRLRLYPSRAVIEVRSSPLPGGGVVTTYTDVTASVMAQEELAVANETLEGRVKERTRELERLNSELIRAKALADEANASKTRFLAAASHDLLQPLNAARLYASAFAERPRASGAAELARHVDGSLEVVEGIISELLDIARFDVGAMRSEMVPLRLDELLRELEREFKPQASAKSLKLRVVRSSAVVSTDRLLLRRLLQNLVSNAIKYTSVGGVLIGARQRGTRVLVEVWDSGVGIAEAEQGAIFEEFKRLPEGARQAQGLGLGLSIVRRIADLLDTPLEVRSRPGRGSVFRLSLPITLEAPRRLAPRRLAVGRGGNHAGLRIAVIDNEPSILSGMRTLLEGWGCICILATNVEDALERLVEHGPPHFIIADYHLDRTDGLAGIAMLRGHFGARIPAILITADRDRSLRQKAAAEEVDLLHKPLKPAALRALLTRKAALAAAE